MEADELGSLSADGVHTVVEYEGVTVEEGLEEGSEVLPSSLHISFHGQEDHAYVDHDCMPEENQIATEATDLQLSEDGTVGGLSMPIIYIQQGLPASGEQSLLDTGGSVISTVAGTEVDGSVLTASGDDSQLGLNILGDGETLHRYQRVVYVNSDGLTTTSLVEAGGEATVPSLDTHHAPSSKRVKLEPGTANPRLGDTTPHYILTMAQPEVSSDESTISSAPAISMATPTVTVTTRVTKKRKTVSHKSASQASDDPKPGPGGINLNKDGMPAGEEDMDVTQAWFTTRDDKVALQSKGHQWRQGQWSRDEVELLQLNIMRFCQDREIADPTEIIFNMSKDERKDFYRTVAKGLERPLFSVYRRVIRMYDQKNHLGKYTPEELQQLRELRTKHGTDWATIGAALGRSASSVKDRCRLMKDTCNSGKWLPEKERRLTQAVYDQAGVPPGEGVTHGLSWALVAERVATRSEKQCRTKWLNYLNWKQKGGVEWTREDDLLLIKKLSESGVTDDTDIDWGELASQLRSARSPQWLRGKWWTIKRHVHNYQGLSLPEILNALKTMGTLDVRTKPEFKVSTLDNLQHITAQSGNFTFTIPLSAINPDGTVSSSHCEEEVVASSGEGGAAVSAHNLELLQGLTPGSQHGTWLLTQPSANPGGAISLAGNGLGSDHIIVHMLPLNQAQLEAVSEEESACIQRVAVQMDPHVIIQSQGEGDEVGVPGGEGGLVGASVDSPTLQLVDHTLITHPHSDLQVLSQSDELSEDQEGLDSQEEISDQGNIISAGDVTYVDTSQSLRESAVNVSSAPTIFVTNACSTSLMHNMSSLSDPMLPAEGSDLITTADNDLDKSQGQEVDESEADIPSS